MININVSNLYDIIDTDRLMLYNLPKPSPVVKVAAPDLVS